MASEKKSTEDVGTDWIQEAGDRLQERMEKSGRRLTGAPGTIAVPRRQLERIVATLWYSPVTGAIDQASYLQALLEAKEEADGEVDGPIRCPKCYRTSGDSWRCGGPCPMREEADG